jgi:hypothetical protein
MSPRKCCGSSRGLLVLKRYRTWPGAEQLGISEAARPFWAATMPARAPGVTISTADVATSTRGLDAAFSMFRSLACGKRFDSAPGNPVRCIRTTICNDVK